MSTPAIDRARRFSASRLERLRASMPSLVPAGVAVVACGSYARQEASAASDFDYFAVAPASASEPTWSGPLKEGLERIVNVAPAGDGAFGKVETRESMVRNIGGQGDDNQKLTRRMLFLLEGAPLSAEDVFADLRRAILDRYLRAVSPDEPLALFLLHDVIRYYRTMAVDYEFKTTEGEPPKPWGLRKVKLMFSRRLLYAGGLFSVAATLEPGRRAKTDRLEELLGLLVTDRIGDICGRSAAAPTLRSYDRFLAFLEDAEVRRRLEALTLADHEDPVFAEVKAEGERFAGALLRLFHDTFGPGHPIHRAVVL